MKKTKLSLILLLIVSMMFSILPGFVAEAAIGSQSFSFPTAWSIRRAGSNDVLRNVNFDYGFSSIEFHHRTENGGTVSVRIDSPTGKKIASFSPSDLSGYTLWTERVERFEITETVEGTHDVYFCADTGDFDFISATFYYFEGSSTLYRPYGETSTNESVKNLENKHKINFLSDLGIMDLSNENFDKDVPLSRIRFLRALSGFYDLSELPDVPVGIFMDVENTEDRKIAYFLYLKGTIILDDTGYLNPHEFITSHEAAEYAANMLGYDGDFRVIAKLDVGKDSYDGYLRPAQMADIIYNTAFHNYRVRYKTQSGATWYEEYDSYFLNYTKGYEIGEGLVSATSYTGIYDAADTVADYNVRINETEYNIGTTNADEFLGVYSYYVYETDENGIETIKAIAPVSPEYITEIDSSKTFTEISDSKIKYLNEKGKKEEIKLHGGTSIIYNGKALDVELHTVIPDTSTFCGKITVIDNNKDKLGDTLVITHAKSIIIKGVSETFLSSSLNSSDIYNFTDNERVEFVRHGRIANAVDFSIGECVDVYESKSISGTKLYRVVYCPESIDGTIMFLGSDGEIVFDDGNTCKLSPNTTYVPSVGDSGMFFLNSLGNVVFCKSTSANALSVGWLYKIILSDEDEVGYATLRTKDNKVVRYQFANRVFVDGVRTKGYSELKSGKAGATTAMNSKAGMDLREPILYRINSDNMLDLIDTLNQVHTPAVVYDSIRETLANGNYVYRGKHFYTGANVDLFQSVGFLTGNTACFSISSFGNEGDLFTEHTPRDSVHGINVTGYSYGLDEKRGFDIIAMPDFSGSAGGFQPPFVVTDKAQVMNKNGEVIFKITGMANSAPIECFSNASKAELNSNYAAMIELIEPGDLVLCRTIEGSVITDLEIVHFGDNDYLNASGNSKTASNGVTVTSLLKKTTPSADTTDPDYDSDRWGEIKSSQTVNGSFVFYAGKITEVGTDYITTSRMNTGKIDYRMMSKDVKVIYVGDRGMDIDVNGSMSTLQVGQNVICFIDEVSVETFYVFNNFN